MTTPLRFTVAYGTVLVAALLPYICAAIAKWGRVTMLSPRAMTHGYAWADTLAHELTHLSITRATRDRAPLWLRRKAMVLAQKPPCAVSARDCASASRAASGNDRRKA